MKCPHEEGEDTAAAGAVVLREKEVSAMPGFDGTGPMGAGPMTGGGRGRCNPAYAGYGMGIGRGSGYGRGRGFRRGFGAGCGRGFGGRAFSHAWGAAYAPANAPSAMNPRDEAGMLRDEAEYMKQELDAIQKRLEELEAKPQQP